MNTNRWCTVGVQESRDVPIRVTVLPRQSAAVLDKLYDRRQLGADWLKIARWWTQSTTAQRRSIRSFQTTICPRTTATITSITSSISILEDQRPGRGCCRARHRLIATRDRDPGSASRRRRSTRRMPRCSHCRAPTSTRPPVRRVSLAPVSPALWKTWVSTLTPHTSTTS